MLFHSQSFRKRYWSKSCKIRFLGRTYLTCNCRVVSKLYLSLVNYPDRHSWVTLMSKLMECKLMEKLSNQDTWETNLVVRKLVKQWWAFKRRHQSSSCSLLWVASACWTVDYEQSLFFLWSVEQNTRHANGHAPRLLAVLVGLQYFCRYKTFFSLQVVVLTFSVHFANFGCMIRLASAGLNTLEFWRPIHHKDTFNVFIRFCAVLSKAFLYRVWS